jgi:glycosyltransferase involved in cell wall biosynthesis
MGMDVPKYGGIERFNIELLKMARIQGDELCFIYETEPENSAYIEDIKANNGKYLVMNSRKNPVKFAWNFFLLLKRTKPDIVHAHFVNARYIAILVAYLMRVPYRYQTIHSAVRDDAGLMTKTALGWMLKMCRTITVSEAIKKQLIERYKIKIKKPVCIYLGANRFSFDKTAFRKRLGINENEIIIICIANFNQVKGVDILLSAIKELEDSTDFLNCKLIIVGQPDKDKRETGLQIKESGLANDVYLWGIRNDIPQILSMGDIYCQPSRSEGLPLAIMEALMAGLPVIGSDVGGIPEAVETGYNGILVPPENVKKLKEAILLLINNTDLRNKYAHNSRIKSADFDVDTGVKKLYDLYHKNEKNLIV